ncbi:MAG: nuclear transport factor 2 family protein [Alphaproteobacteria bacterium]|nr:nuclear transport factor 2 family protein [Alphaproteobacteria bacterium]
MKAALALALLATALAAPVDAKPRGAAEAARAMIAALETKNRDAALALLAPEVVVEYPFDRSGRTTPGSWRRFEGRDAVMAGYIDNAFARIKRIDFTNEIVTESRDRRTAFVETTGDMELGNGAPYRNMYVLKFETDRQGRIFRYKEYLNPVTSALATGAPLGDAAVAPPPPPPVYGAGRCDAAKAQFAVGEPYSDVLLERARTAAGAGIARRLLPGQAVTMEYRGDRLSLLTDAAGKVASARCG